VRANRALLDICVTYGVPLISGKDSMKNDYRIGDTAISIPPTLLFSLVAKVPDVRKAVTMDFKKGGNLLYCIGTTYPELGASEYALMKNVKDTTVPVIHDPEQAFNTYISLFSAIQDGLVRACHDISDGGLGVALAEMCFSGETGAAVSLSAMKRSGCTSDIEVLFSESPCRILIEVEPANALRVGTVVKGDMITVAGLEQAPVLGLSRIDAKAAWKSTLQF
jgi:phosphoribosylformylglycinamidine (FGAM) synthase-like enzyme